MWHRGTKIAPLLLCGAAVLLAQDTPPTLRFEVASIRPTNPHTKEGSSWRTTPAGDIRAHSVPVLALILSAYDVQEFQVVGYPSWVVTDMFDVDAKTGEVPAVDSQPPGSDRHLGMRSRLQALLAERCNLAVRRTTENKDCFVLTVDSRGLKMALSEPVFNVIQHPYALSADGIPMARLVPILSSVIQEPVQDQTGLQGAYKVDLHWSRSVEGPTVPNGPPGTDITEIVRALREQLGLTLLKRKAPLEILIVTQIQRPSEN